MDVRTEIKAIEGRLKAAELPVAELLRRANVNSAQWVRWKQGKQTPLMTTWTRITAAADKLAEPMRARA